MTEAERAKRNAAYQRAYRERHTKSADGALARLSVLVSVQAKAALERLAGHHGLSHKAMLQKLLVETESDLVDRMTDGERTRYWR